MTGGVAYLVEWDQLNADSVVAREVPAEDADELKALVEEHHRRTGSRKAAEMLASWDQALKSFRQVVPVAAAAPPAEAMPDTAQTAPQKDSKTAA